MRAVGLLHRLLLGLLVFAGSGGGSGRLLADEGETALAVTILPPHPTIERRGDEQRLSFDLVVDNGGTTALRLVAIRLTVFDGADRVVLVRELDENGRPPAIDVVGDRTLAVGAALDLYNPFFSFDGDVPLHRLRFELCFTRGGRKPGVPLAFDADVVRVVDVLPVDYAARSELRLPLAGRTLVYDGHDFYSHHRRHPASDRAARQAGRARAANLYAYDFVRVDGEGRPFRGDPFVKEHWLSYGVDVVAPAGGVVVDSANDIAENRFEGGRVVAPPPSGHDPEGMGNHVVIDHGNGEFSVLLHLQPGSVRVRMGQRIAQGQPLGRIGFSGDALIPHLHFFVATAARYPMQGVPSYFRHFRRILGARSEEVARGQIDTGDLVESMTP